MQGELQARRRAGKSKPGLMMRTTEKRVFVFVFFPFLFSLRYLFCRSRVGGKKNSGTVDQLPSRLRANFEYYTSRAILLS